MMNEEELERRLGLIDSRRRPIVLPFFIWALIVASVIVICIALPGCASVTKEETQVCFLKYLGGTESGLSVVRSLCMTEAQFAEMQK